MSYNDFLKTIQTEISDKLGERYSVSLKKVLKNNSVEFDALIIRENETTVTPSIYLNSYYLELKSGKTIEEIIDMVMDVYNSATEKLKVGTAFSINSEDFSEKVVFKLVNYEKNRELLKNSPYMRVDDLAVTFHYLATDNEEGVGMVRITDANAGSFNIDREHLWENARRNTARIFPPVTDEICDVLLRLAESGPADTDDERAGMQDEIRKMLSDDRHGLMYVLTNKKGMYGASCLLYEGVLEQLYEKFEGGFYIIPSSVNEVILIPEGELEDPSVLEEMIGQVNREHVPEEEILSDRAYHYPEDSFAVEDFCGI